MRHGLRVSIALIGVVAASMLGVRAAGARSSEESDFLAKINAERTSRGLGALAWSDHLASVARSHSNEMADRDELYHNPNLANEVHDDWAELGENVGYGANVVELHDAFMDSQVHRDSILHATFTKLGVGTTWRDGILWVTQVFEKPMQSQQVSQSSPSKPSPARRPARRVSGRTARGPAAPVAAPRVAVRPPAAAAPPVGDLTVMMVTRLLGADEPAVTSVHAAGDALPAAGELLPGGSIKTPYHELVSRFAGFAG